MNSMSSVVVSKSAHNPPTAMPIISPTPMPEKNHAELIGECVIFSPYDTKRLKSNDVIVLPGESLGPGG